MTGAPTEQDLIRKARGGDQQAFAELVMLHADRVYGALRRFGLDAVDADEVAQEVFLRAWRGLGAVRGESPALHVAVPDRLQRGPAPARAPDAPPRAARTAKATRPIPWRRCPSPSNPGPRPGHWPASSSAGSMRRWTSCLPEWRDAVVLRDIEGLSTHDAAEVVGVGEAAFKSRLHRGRMQLRALLEPYLGLEEG